LKDNRQIVSLERKVKTMVVQWIRKCPSCGSEKVSITSEYSDGKAWRIIFLCSNNHEYLIVAPTSSTFKVNIDGSLREMIHPISY
jgi:transcription elongation factor Elf1